jgi:hypothetical protein
MEQVKKKFILCLRGFSMFLGGLMIMDNLFGFAAQLVNIFNYHEVRPCLIG